jgi:signal transduction histidine kinase
VSALLIPNDDRRVDVHVSECTPDVNIDPDKMQLALTNLLSNAYKYSPKEGNISLELVLVPGSERPVRLRVRDQGIGMTPEQLEHATERFYRADTSGNIPGTGLGLSLVREIVELHGGRLTLESERGRGTVATIELPAAQESSPPA